MATHSNKMKETINLASPDHTTTIPEFYTGKNIFITGGTGFLGKVLIEKLLRSCPNVGNIYMLIRPKKGKELQDRVDVMLKDQLFNTIKQTDPNQLSKLIPIAGDCSQLKLGLSEPDYRLLTSSVSIIYHAAASVRFDDHLQQALLLNTRGTREMATLALETVKLAVFVHVSTTYCNSVVGREIHEQLYPCPADWRKSIKIAEEFDVDVLALLSDKYLGGYPNTYTFTKVLGEHVVKDLCEGEIPTVICRPSIVISSLKDPVKGWIDNFNGPMGLLTACAKGLLRMGYQDENIHSDLIPVDIVIKAIVTATWDLGLRQQKSSTEVVQCCAGPFKRMSIVTLIKLGREYSAEIPFNTIAWVPKGYITNSKLYSYICVIFFHLLPCFFLDMVVKVAGKKPFLVKLQIKIYNALLQVRYFNHYEWDFSNKRFLELESKILKVDKANWSYDFRTIDIHLYAKDCMRGGRKYLFNEHEDTLEAAQKNYWRMYWLDKVTMAILYGSFAWLILHYGLIEKTVDMIFNYVYYYFDGKNE